MRLFWIIDDFIFRKSLLIYVGKQLLFPPKHYHDK